MICFKCNSEEFDVLEAKISQEFRGEKLEMETPVHSCKKCGWQTLDDAQTNELRKRTADAYRRKYHLLTAKDIVSLREIRGMSQEAFARFVEVGVASIKRWESGAVQESVYDQIIRLKCGHTSFPIGLFTTKAVSFNQGNFSISTHFVIGATNLYIMQPIEISSNISRMTNRMTAAEELAKASKNHRKKYSCFCNAEV